MGREAREDKEQRLRLRLSIAQNSRLFGYIESVGNKQARADVLFFAELGYQLLHGYKLPNGLMLCRVAEHEQGALEADGSQPVQDQQQERPQEGPTDSMEWLNNIKQFGD